MTTDTQIQVILTPAQLTHLESITDFWMFMYGVWVAVFQCLDLPYPDSEFAATGYAIPEGQWHRLAKHILSMEGDEMRRVSMCMEWVNKSPSAYPTNPVEPFYSYGAEMNDTMRRPTPTNPTNPTNSGESK